MDNCSRVKAVAPGGNSPPGQRGWFEAPIVHEWKPTGRSKLVIPEGPRGLMAGWVRYSFVRCSLCNTVGFRRGDSRVVFTWV